MYPYGPPHMAEQKQEYTARIYVQQLCEDTGYSPEDLPEAMKNREKWRERVRDVRAGGATWWRWWYKRESVEKFSVQSENYKYTYRKSWIYLNTLLYRYHAHTYMHTHTHLYIYIYIYIYDIYTQSKMSLETKN